MAESSPPIAPDPTAEDLSALAPRMGRALQLRQAGDDVGAARVLREILLAEPRLAEPRLELAHIAALTGDWEEAEEQARFAVEILQGGGQWSLDLAPDQLLSFALNLLGEVVVRPLEEGDLLLVDRAGFEARWNEAAGYFAEAVRADPKNDEARRNTTRYAPVKPR